MEIVGKEKNTDARGKNYKRKQTRDAHSSILSLTVVVTTLIHLLILCCSCPSVQSSAPTVPRQSSSIKMNQFKTSLNTFNFKFLNLVTFPTSKNADSKDSESKSAEECSKNVFYSPLSISTALGMLVAGSNGTTRDEIMAALSLDSTNSIGQESFEKVIVEYMSKTAGSRILANRVIVNQGFNIVDTYQHIIKDNFRAEITSQSLSDPTIVGTINDWCSSKTNGMINKLIDSPFDSLTQLVLLNAIYFKENWSKTFDREKTEDAQFRNIDSTIGIVRMMAKKDKLRFLINENLNYSMIEMPYKGSGSDTRNRSPNSSPNGASDGAGGASMVILLPHQDKGILTLLSNESNMKAIHEDAVKNVKKAFKVETNLYLPSFELETSYDLKETLQLMGIKSVFDPVKSDLSGITGARAGTDPGSDNATITTPNLSVSSVIHKAKVIVNEEGAEAAAVTQVAISYRSMPLTEEFSVDHPFLFLIKDNDLILFTGIIYKF